MAQNQITIDIKLNMIGMQGLSQLGTAFTQLGARMNTVGTGINRVAPAVAAVAQKTGMVQQLSNAFFNTDKNVKNLFTRLSDAERRFDPIFRAGFRMQMVGNDLYNLGLMGIRALSGLMSQFGNFEFMVNRSAGAMGILKDTMIPTGDAAGTLVNAYDALTNKIMEAATAAKLFPAQDVAQAMYYWASATGLQVKSLGDLDTSLAGVTTMMQAAAMTQTDIQTVIKGTYSVLIQYGLGLDQTTRITEDLFLITQRTAAEFPDLINSFKMVGPVAHSIGVGFEDVAKTLGELADAGIRGTIAGRALRQFFIQTVRPSAAAQKAVEALFGGTKSYLDLISDSSGNFIGFDAWIGKLAERTQNLTSIERAHILAQITTANELPVVTAMVQAQIASIKGLPGAWDASKYSMTGASKAFREQWGLLANSWNGVMATFQRALDNVRLIVGRTLSETFTPLIKGVTTALSGLGDWVATHQDAVALAGKIVAIGSAALITTGLLFKLVGGLLAVGASIAVTIAGFVPLIARLTFFGGLVGGIVDAVIKNWDYLVHAFQEAQKNITDALAESGNAIGNVKGLLDDMFGVFRQLGTTIVKSFADGLVWVSKGLAAILANKDAVNVLTQLVKLIAAFLAVKYMFGLGQMIAMFLGLGKAITALRFAYALTGFSSMALKIGESTVAVTGLRSGMSALALIMGGPLGIVGIIAAIGAAFLLATPAGQDFLNKITDAFRDAKNELKDLQSQLGSFAAHASNEASKIAQAQAKNLANLKGLSGQLAKDILTDPNDIMKLLLGGGSAESLGSTFGQKFGVATEQEIAKLQANIEASWISMTQDTNDILAQLGAGDRATVGMDQLFTKAFDYQTKLGLGWEEALRMSQSYFIQTGNVAAASKDEITSYYNKLQALNGGKLDFSLEQFLGVNFDDAAYKSRLEAEATKAAQLFNDNYFGHFYDEISSLASSGNTYDQQKALSELTPFLKGGQLSNMSSENAAKAGALLSQLTSNGFMTGYDENGNPIVNTMEQIRADTDKALNSELEKIAADYAATMGGFGKKIKEALKGPGDVKAGFEAISQLFDPKSFLQKNINSKSSQVRDLAQLWIDQNLNTFQDVINNALPGQQEQLYAKIQKFISGGIPKNLSEGQLSDLADVINQLYSKLGKPIPAWVTKRLNTQGKNMVGAVIDGAKTSLDTSSVSSLLKSTTDLLFPGGKKSGTIPGYEIAVTVKPPNIPSKADTDKAMQPYLDSIGAAGGKAMGIFQGGFDTAKPGMMIDATNTVDSVRSKLSNVAGFFGGGITEGVAWANGLQSGFEIAIARARAAAAIVARIIGNSPPKEGPLVHAYSGGYSVAMLWAEGYKKATPRALSYVRDYAKAVNGITKSVHDANFGATTKISSDRRSHHTVEVKVTSPDGSVDRMKASELERALNVSSVWDEIEHQVSLG